MHQFPINTTTRKGTKVILTGYYSGYSRPWVGFIEVDLEDEKFLHPLSWRKGGRYISEEVERSLDIEVPQ